MWRRLNREEFEQVNPVRRDPGLHEDFTWRVYANYKLLDDTDGISYFCALENEEGNIVPVKTYRPLVDTPYLFLEFARLYERMEKPEGYLDLRPLWDWIEKYGLLGHEIEHKPSAPDDGYVYKVISKALPYSEPSDLGGVSEALDMIILEAEELNKSLLLYEAALSHDVDKLLEALKIMYGSPSSSAEELLYRDPYFDPDHPLEGYLMERIIHSLNDCLNLGLRRFISPTLAFPRTKSAIPPSDLGVNSIEAGLRPHNLLGAIYLQFYWLVTSGGKLSRCKYCNRILIQGGTSNRPQNTRKNRSDKMFCDSRCRQNYHYHNHRKPAQE